MSISPPVIGFELGVGEFRIVTPEAVYHIKVTPELVTANTGMGVISPGAPGLAPAPVPEIPLVPEHSATISSESGFFQEITQELFDRVGHLARQLSVSVRELPDNAPASDGLGLSQTGDQLEDAKGQLQEVVEMTEKASMTVMDLADQIQADMDNLNIQMTTLSDLDFISVSKEEAAEVPVASGDSFLPVLAEIRAFVSRFTATNGADPDEVAVEIPVDEPPQTSFIFDLSEIFQTLYEFCTNESVKDHIKIMRDECAAGAFNNDVVLSSLMELANTLEVDDGFYNIPIPALLKILYANTTSEQNKTTLKKMNQTVASIFQENVLPIEGHEVTLPPQTKASSPVVEANVPALPTVEDMVELARLVSEMDVAILGGATGSPSGIQSQDRETIANSIKASNSLIKSTSMHLTRIMEALSFQDLSGQRIKKIVGLISDIQVTLLSLLVSVDTKIKAHHEAPSAVRPKEETEKVAQAEVDKMLEKLGGESSELMGPGAENRLDQGAVNDLLAGLGF